MKHAHKLLSLMLTICIVMSMLTGFAPTNAVADTAETNNEVFELPDIVDSVEAKENDYIGRVEAEEKDLSTFVFANGNGTNTMRIYSHPVKYVADDGSIRDISLDIKAKRGGGFVTADHEIVTTFESKLTDGITLKYNDIEVMLVPELGLSAIPTAKLSTDSKVVTYEVNNTTSFVYELTYAGFKEDIVVEEYTGQTEYEFTLFTNGLTLCEEYGSYYLADSEGNMEATIGDIIVFTADERNNTMGSMTYETVRANQEYVLTIHLDADYLADEDTVYPIRIDPTIEINYNNNGAGAIEDVTISQNTTYNGTSGSLYVGRHPESGLSRALMRFPNLSLNGISANQITAATVELRDLMCQGSEDITIECRIYNKSAPAWSESGTTTWSSIGTAYIGSLLDSHVISFGQGNAGDHRYSFNILAAAKAWANNTQSPAKGLVFKANSAFENQTGDAIKTWYKTFAAYNRSAYRPSLSIEYHSTLFLNYASISIPEGGSRTLVATTNPSGQIVDWSTSDSSIATVNMAGKVTGVRSGTTTITATMIDEDGLTHTASCKVSVYIPSGVYRLKNVDNGLYLDVTGGGTTAGTEIQQWARAASDTNRNQLFKLVYMGTYGSANLNYYCIRPMTNSGMGVSAPYSSNGENVTLQTMSISDLWSTILYDQSWAITRYGSTSVTIRNGPESYSSYLTTPENSTDGERVLTTSSITTNSCWILEPYTGTAINGVTFQDIDYMVLPGQSFTYKVCMYSSIVGQNGPIEYSIRNMDGSETDKATIDPNTGNLTALKPGKIKVRFTYSGAPWVWYATVNIARVIEIACFAQDGYWDVSNGLLTGTVECNDAAKRTHSVWFIDYQNNGYFTIRNYSTGYYIVNSNSSLKYQFATTPVTDSMQWKFIEQSDGTFKIASKVNSNYYITENQSAHWLSGPDIGLSNYNEGQRQQWHVFIKEYSISINNYYDYSFQMRMDNSLTTNTNTLKVINDRQARLNDFLYYEYAIVVTNNTPSRRVSYADKCHGTSNVSASTIEQDCTHGDCDGLHGLCSHILNGSGSCSLSCESAFHHNNSFKIHSWYKNELTAPTADINILWTGHKNCLDDNMYVPWSGGTHITATLYNSSCTGYWDYTAFHETGHSLGASGDDTCTDTSCAMSYSSSWSLVFDLLELPSADLFCDVCDSQIRSETHYKYN